MESQDIVIFIQSDPKESPRPCEAVRIALGLAACDHPVRLIFSQKAACLLTDDIEACIDGEPAQGYLETLKEFVPVLYVEDGVAISGAHKTVVLSSDEISKKIATATCFFSF